jgi:hypothetical protein
MDMDLHCNCTAPCTMSDGGLAVFAQVQARLVALQQKAAGITRAPPIKISAPSEGSQGDAPESSLGFSFSSSQSESEWSSFALFELNVKIDNMNGGDAIRP